MDERSLPELGRLLDDLRRDTVRKDVYDAEQRGVLARIKRLEDDDTSKAAGNRNWLFGLVQTAFGVVLGLLGAYLMSRGQHP